MTWMEKKFQRGLIGQETESSHGGREYMHLMKEQHCE